jgi:hypothetical protein
MEQMAWASIPDQSEFDCFFIQGKASFIVEPMMKAGVLQRKIMFQSRH